MGSVFTVASHTFAVSTALYLETRYPARLG